VSGRRSVVVAAFAAVAVVVVASAGFVAGSRSRGGSASASASAPAEDSVDVGFLRDMADHHEQAVRMSLLVIRADGVSPAVRDLAVGIIASQRHDLGRMEAWLTDWGYGRGTPSRRAMAWMGHARVTPGSMPGMASPAELTALGSSSGTDAEVRFLDLMLAHHEGALSMAEAASAGASTAKVVRLADLIGAGQQEEILELQSLRRQLLAAGTLEVPAKG
jgi:uncharacterized protein (DUF305 family)